MLIYLQIIETAEDKSKFEEIYHEYRGLMYHVAYNRLRNSHDAEDVVHHAFVKIAENIKTIEPVSPKTKQFVVTIVDNRVTDIFRIRGRHTIVEYEDKLCTDFDTEIEHEDLLTQCILKLPEHQRTVILLKYTHGYSLREISKLMNLSLSWTQKIDQRAKKKLAELYQEAGGKLDLGRASSYGSKQSQ